MFHNSAECEITNKAWDSHAMFLLDVLVKIRIAATQKDEFCATTAIATRVVSRHQGKFIPCFRAGKTEFTKDWIADHD